ncbi:Cof-type HAD-IIB family hydrolase [Barrientosiimonas marina]|uniref:Cof-type HAD-IIB family hydrolase n=1 Tax=Lentibacillus kimchii TaxID=1542911 RepID=A0ABW2UUE0_9BACI
MKTKQHLIALDLDGTLLTADKKISQTNLNIIRKAINNGHIVVIATGRPHRSSIDYYQTLKLDTPMVNFNGALIHHPADAKWHTLHNPMPVRSAQHIIEACYNLGVRNIVAEVMDSVYIDQYDEQMMELFQNSDQNTLFTIGSLKNKLQTDPTSLLIHPHADNADQLRSHLDHYHAELIEHRKWGLPWNIIEIVKKGLNKAIGLQKVAYYYHIPKERIIAFGDEDNDLEMIDYAGVGVAMGNAIDELKTVSKYITDTNEMDGIGHFLNDYLNLHYHDVKTDNL